MITRRNFLKTSATVLATGLVNPAAWSETAFRSSILGANDRIHVGLIGCKNMGWSNLFDFLKHPEVECVALCDIDQNVLRERAAEVEKLQNK